MPIVDVLIVAVQDMELYTNFKTDTITQCAQDVRKQDALKQQIG